MPDALAQAIADLLGPLPGVVAVAMGGSRGGAGLGADAASDLDLEVYTNGAVALSDRRAVVEAIGGATRLELGNDAWGLADEWIHAPSGIVVDLTYLDAGWMEDRIAGVLDRHEANLGYTTCFWHTIRGCIVLDDRSGWLSRLKQRSAVPYPEELRRAIVARNHPVLRASLSSYVHQIESAVARRDLVSIQHRLTGLLASYFDILFALNRVPHPGEKRQVEAATRLCSTLPVGLEDDLDELLRTATTDLPGLRVRFDRLLDRLDDLLRAEGSIGR